MTNDQGISRPLPRSRARGVGAFVVLLLLLEPVCVWCISGCDRQTPSQPPADRTARITPETAAKPIPGPATPPAPSESSAAQVTRPAAATPATASTQPNIPANGVVAYYFHRTLRCMTCLAIEKNAKEAIEIAYLDALNDGRLAWLPVDYEAPANWHFAKDYALETSTLVLVEMRGGKPARWKALPKTWELIGDPGGFQEYVWAEVKEYLGG